MWLTKSSIGRKLVMSVTGLALIFFLLFHGAMNLVAVFSESGYKAIVHFLGTNPIVQFMVPALALLFVLHIVFSVILTIQNRRARGNDRYAVTGRSDVEWSAKNMFVLGLVVLLGIALHLVQFWSKMQLREWTGVVPEDGYALIQHYFSNPLYVGIYLVWFVAIWFHLTHGFWSALQTIGWNNQIWYRRLKVIGVVLSTVICLMFAFVAIAFYLQSIGVWSSVGHLWTLGQH